MTAVFCRNARDRKADSRIEQLRAFPRLEFAVSDAAEGIAAAVARQAAGRHCEPGSPRLEHGLDVFHTAREAGRVLARHWRRAEAAREAAEQAEARAAGTGPRGPEATAVSGTEPVGEAALGGGTAPRRGEVAAAATEPVGAADRVRPGRRRAAAVGRRPGRRRAAARTAAAAWQRAIAAFEEAQRPEAAWRRAAAALEWFDADGRLNDRTRAAAAIAAAVKELDGAEWAQVRAAPKDPRSPTFLDRLHRRLEAAEPRPDRREAMAWRWWLRHGRVARSDPLMDRLGGRARGRKWDEEERASYEQVAAVLADAHRASSAVECRDSGLRMQQARHRRMTQPMLDLKRLYWNGRVFRSGPRKGRCPDRVLGRELPTSDFWELLRRPGGLGATTVNSGRYLMRQSQKLQTRYILLSETARVISRDFGIEVRRAAGS